MHTNTNIENYNYVCYIILLRDIFLQCTMIVVAATITIIIYRSS